MDAAQALAELTEISSQIDAAAIADNEGSVIAATLANGNVLAGAGRALLEQAARVQSGRVPAQLDASTAQGSVFVVREGERTIVATTTPEPAVGLVFYDLKTCLRTLEPKQPRRRRTKEKEPADAA